MKGRYDNFNNTGYAASSATSTFVFWSSFSKWMIWLFFASTVVLVHANNHDNTIKNRNLSQDESTVDCPLALLIPLHDSRRDTLWFGGSGTLRLTIDDNDDNPLWAGISLLATALFAIDDFNKRKSSILFSDDKATDENDGSLFFEKFNILPSCPVQLSVSGLWDTSSAQSSNMLQQSFLQSDSNRNIWETSCAIIGPHDEESLKAVRLASELAMSTGATDKSSTDLAIFSYGQILEESRKDNNKNNNVWFGSATWEDSTKALIDYLIVTNRSEGVAILQSSTEPTYFFEIPDNSSISLHRYYFVEPERYIESLSEVLKEVKALDGMKTIIVNWEWDDRLEDLARIAQSVGLVPKNNDNSKNNADKRNDYQWIFFDRYLSPMHVDLFEVAADSAVEHLLHRTLVYQTLDHLVPRLKRYDIMFSTETDYSETLTKFFPQWKAAANNRDMMSQLNELVHEALGLKDDMAMDISSDLFVHGSPTYGSGFIYDSIMAAGAIACENYMNDGSTTLSDEAKNPRMTISLPEKFSNVFSVFGGYRSLQGTIDAIAPVFGMYVIDRNYNFIPFWSSIFDFTKKDGTWTMHQEHADLYYGKAVRVVSYILSGISILLSILSALFVYLYREHLVVRAAQPEFLYMVCFGAFMIGLSMIFRSFDDYNIDDWTMLNRFCSARLWMTICGQVMIYMAMFSKLWRINKLMQFRRGHTVFPSDVVWPFALLLVTALTILLVITFQFPPRFYRIYVDLDDDENLDRQPFTVPTCLTSPAYFALVQVPTVLSWFLVVFMAFKARNLDHDLSDVRLVVYIVIIDVIGVFVIVPLMYMSLLHGKLDLSYILLAVWDFLFATYTLRMLVGTKMSKIWKQKMTGKLRVSDTLQPGRVRISGIDLSDVTTTQNILSKMPDIDEE